MKRNGIFNTIIMFVVFKLATVGVFAILIHFGVIDISFGGGSDDYDVDDKMAHVQVVKASSGLTWQDDAMVADSFGGGEGCEDLPYIISSSGHLARLARLVNGGGLGITTANMGETITFEGVYFRLSANIDLRGRDWVSIGGATHSFSGTLDGAGHEIILPSTIRQEIARNSTPMFSAFGLFGVTQDATIQNLRIRGDVIDWYSSVPAILTQTERRIGALVASARDTFIDNVQVVGYLSNIIAPRSVIVVGGVIGYMRYSIVNNTRNHTRLNVISTDNASVYIGGIVGIASGKIINAVNNGNISEVIAGDTLYIGGIVGFASCHRHGTPILRMYNTANYGNINAALVITGRTPPQFANIGGIVGIMRFASSLVNSYNRGDITIQGNAVLALEVGGIVGFTWGASIRVANVYNAGILTAVSEPGQIVARLWTDTEIVNAFGVNQITSSHTGILNEFREADDELSIMTIAWANHPGQLPQLVGLTYVHTPDDSNRFFFVTFLDINGHELTVIPFLQGSTLTPIEAPSVPLYLFLYWRTIEGDELFTAITQDTILLAIYNSSAANFFVSVTFLDNDGNLLFEGLATLGFFEQANIPQAPTIPGLIFSRWFNADGFEINRQITEDAWFWAIYAIDDDFEGLPDEDDVDQILDWLEENWMTIAVLGGVLVAVAVLLSIASTNLKRRRRRR